MSRGVVINVKEVAKRSLLRWHDFSSRAQGCIGMLPEKNNSFWHSIGKAPEVPCFTKMGPSRITWSTFPVLVATDPSKSGEPPVFYPLFCFFAWKVNSLNRITSRCTKLLRKGPASTSIQPHLPSCSSIVNNQKKIDIYIATFDPHSISWFSSTAEQVMAKRRSARMAVGPLTMVSTCPIEEGSTTKSRHALTFVLIVACYFWLHRKRGCLQNLSLVARLCSHQYLQSWIGLQQVSPCVRLPSVLSVSDQLYGISAPIMRHADHSLTPLCIKMHQVKGWY